MDIKKTVNCDFALLHLPLSTSLLPQTQLICICFVSPSFQGIRKRGRNEEDIEQK